MYLLALNLSYSHFTNNWGRLGTIRLSHKSQIVIPKQVRAARGWEPGLEFIVENTGDGIKLKPMSPYSETKVEIGFQKLIGLPNVRIEDPDSIYQAISWYENKLDFADALHLASSRRCVSFATFDSSLIKKAQQISSLKMVKPQENSLHITSESRFKEYNAFKPLIGLDLFACFELIRFIKRRQFAATNSFDPMLPESVK